MKKSDQIIIRGLKISCHLGVPDEERALPQEIKVNITMSPLPSNEPLNDDIDRTVNYYDVSVRLDALAKEKPRKLIESLAEDFAKCVLDEFPVCSVTVEVEKFILPNARHVGVLITRER